MKVFCIFNGFFDGSKCKNSPEMAPCVSVSIFTSYDWVCCNNVTFNNFLKIYFNIFSASYISWRAAGTPEDSIPTIPWAASCHTIPVPHGCKCIWMALIWCESCANLRTGSSKPSIWTASNGTSSNLRCHLDPQCTQLPVQCLIEYSTFCEPPGTWCHHGCICSESH